MKTWKLWTFAAIAALFGMVIAFTACDTGNGGGGDDDGDKSYKYTPGEIVGTGTSADPFHVHDVITLSSVGKTPEGYSGWTLDAHYKQTANIDLAEIDNWTPIGTYIGEASEDNDPFTGSYDGNDYTIKNLTINATTYYQGLFGHIGEDGIVKNVGVIDCDITSTMFGLGGIAAVNYGTVLNCYVTGDIVYSASQLYSLAGGVVGYNYGGTVSNCYTTGNVSGTSITVGGVVGSNSTDGTVLNCYSTSNVSGRAYVGGVVGDNSGGTVSNCYATGDVFGFNYVGGVIGYNAGTDTTVSNCVALNGSITQTSGTNTTYGRVIGGNWYGEILLNNYASSTMTFIDVDNESTTTFPDNADTDNGTDITSTQWSSSTWWTGTAGWDVSIWDFSGISAISYPKLR